MTRWAVALTVANASGIRSSRDSPSEYRFLSSTVMPWSSASLIATKSSSIALTAAVWCAPGAFTRFRVSPEHLLKSLLFIPSFDARGGKRLTEQECRDDFIVAGAGERPALRATWCQRAYRQFEGIYNVTLLVLTQDRSREALLAQLTMQGVSHANAVTLSRRFLEAIQWAPTGVAASGTAKQ